MVERAPRDRRSFDILLVKKEAKLSAREANDVEVGKGDADLRQSNLFTVCQRRRGWPATEKIILEQISRLSRSPTFDRRTDRQTDMMTASTELS